MQEKNPLFIKTKEHSMTRGEYLSIITGNYIRQRWWLFLILWVVAILSVILDSPFAPIAIAFAAISPLIAFLYLWYHAWTPKNRIYYLPRTIELDEGFITACSADGGINRTPLQHFLGAKKTRDSFILRLTKIQFVFVPFRAFESKEDQDAFENILKGKGILGS
jgi:signal transduction histidine kinase